jgi:hypothetical protein
MTAAPGPGRFTLIDGLNNPEDLFLLDEGWVITGNMGTEGWSRGGFYLIEVKTRLPQVLKPDFTGPVAAPFAPVEPPDPALFSAHGISVQPLGGGRYSVYAVNHGGRQSVEAFELDATGATPTIRWNGGVIIPENLGGNAVVHLPDGALAVTITIDSRDPQAFAKAQSGEPCGLALEWNPGRGWSSIPGGEVSGDNGMVASADGAWLYICGYCEGALYKLSRGKAPYTRQRVPLNFLPDNVRYSPGGALLVTGHPATTFAMIAASNRSGAKICQVPTAVARIDPETLVSELILVEQHTAAFGGGTSAIVVGDELWIGGFQATSVATVPLSALGVSAI